MTEDYIDRAFAGLDEHYPNSRRKRRQPSVVQEPTSTWDTKPTIHMYQGTPTEFFTINDLSKALGKKSVTLRLWERKGYIPSAPFRLPSHYKTDGTEVLGRRVYTRPFIEVAVEEFAKRDLIDVPRVEWKQHNDLTIAIYERWQALLNT